MKPQIHKLYVCGYKDSIPEGAMVVNTTSKSEDFGKVFSPFMNQGDIVLNGLRSHNVENIWQFTKVYPEHEDDIDLWVKWRDEGLRDKFAHRYPMGKGAIPKFSCIKQSPAWDKNLSEKLSYIQARKEIYIPAYVQKLKNYCLKEVNWLIGMLHSSDVYLWDFDGYLTDLSFKELVHKEEKSLGHAFILKKFVANRLKIDF